MKQSFSFSEEDELAFRQSIHHFATSEENNKRSRLGGLGKNRLHYSMWEMVKSQQPINARNTMTSCALISVHCARTLRGDILLTALLDSRLLSTDTDYCPFIIRIMYMFISTFNIRER